MSRQMRGHLICVFTSLIWGSSFIATRFLLDTFSNAQVMLLRFIPAYLVALAIDRHFPKPTLRGEALFALLAFTGVMLYHLLENTALQLTSTANASILVSLSPLFTMLLTFLLLREGCFTRTTVLGCVIAIVGVVLVVFNGTIVMQMNPLGDLCALGAALCWGSYSVLVRVLQKEYTSTLIGRKSLFWSIVFVLPVLLLEHKPFPLSSLWTADNLTALFFCGILASGVCNVVANIAIGSIGPVAATNYNYSLPFISMVTARLILKEPISAMGAFGAVLTVLGVLISSYTPRHRLR